MNLNLPFGKAHRERQAEMKRADLDYIKEKTAATKVLVDAREKAMTAMAKITEPKMVMNSELYGDSSSPYKLDVFGLSRQQAQRKSRIAYADAPPAKALIGRFVDMVIGPRLKLQAAPIWDMIPNAPTDKEARKNLTNAIESGWQMWGRKKSIDYENDLNYFKFSRQIFEDYLVDGEYFVILRYASTRKRSPLTLQRILPENIKKINSKVLAGNTEIDGIEYDSRGRAVAYHVITNSGTTKDGTFKSVRIPRFGTKSGRTFVIHNKLGKGRRGVGILVGIITEIAKLADYQALEIQASVINALFAVVVETEIGGEMKPKFDKDGIAGNVSTPSIQTSPFDQNDYQMKLDKTMITRGGNIVEGLGEGQKMKSFDTARPTANFEMFYKAVLRNIFSAAGMPYAAAMYDMDESYSSIRGILLVFWNRVMTLRLDQSNDFDMEIYLAWLWGEVDRGKYNLVGWETEEIRDAWINSHWTGPARPDIDPKRSADAHALESKHAWKDDQKITAERNGGDWSDNIERKKAENELKAEANEPIVRQEKTTYSFSENKTESETVSKEG